MIRHVVMWKFKGSMKERFIHSKIVANLLNDLVGKIKNIHSLETIINNTTTDDNNWDLVLDSVFNNINDLEIYQNHPLHKSVAKIVGELREERACVDSEF